jgi:hypothetical protein
MKPILFKPRYTRVLWVLILLYAGPWLFSLPNAVFGNSPADWKLFWLLSGTVWMLAGLLHMRSVLLKRIVFEKEICIEMFLQERTRQGYRHPVRIRGDLAHFKGQAVQMRYFANTAELMQVFVSLAAEGRLEMVYEPDGRKGAEWTREKNLLCLIVFALYMMVMLALRLQPLHLVGLATDAFLFGWAMMLPVLMVIKVIRITKERARLREQDAAKWI